MIRSASNQDEVPISALVFDVLKDYGLKPDPETTDADLKDIESHYIKGGGVFDVLLDSNNSIIGTVGLYPLTKSQCELRKMYLHPNHKGKGFGKVLMDHAILKAKKMGFTSIVLETASILKEAINLYKKYGFEPYELEHLSERCDQAYIKHIESGSGRG